MGFLLPQAPHGFITFHFYRFLFTSIKHKQDKNVLCASLKWGAESIYMELSGISISIETQRDNGNKYVLLLQSTGHKNYVTKLIDNIAFDCRKTRITKWVLIVSWQNEVENMEASVSLNAHVTLHVCGRKPEQPQENMCDLYWERQNRGYSVV